MIGKATGLQGLSREIGGGGIRTLVEPKWPETVFETCNGLAYRWLGAKGSSKISFSRPKCTFSCDIAYSESRAASRASLRSKTTGQLANLPYRTENMPASCITASAPRWLQSADRRKATP